MGIIKAVKWNLSISKLNAFYFFLATLYSGLCFADNTFKIQDNLNSQSLNEYFQIYEDESRQLSIEDISQAHYDNKFISLNNRKEDLGFSNSVFWLKFTLENNSNSDYWLLKNNYNSIQQLDLYEQKNNRTFKTFESGFLKPISVREYESYRMILPLYISKNKSKTYYLRIKTLTPVIINFEIKSKDNVIKSEAFQNVFSGVFLGMMLILVLVDFLFYFILRIKGQLYLAIFTFCMLTVFSLYDGILLPYIPSFLTQYSTIFVLTNGCIAVLSLYLYYEQLLLTNGNNQYKTLSRFIVFPYWIIIILLLFSTDTYLPVQMYVTGFLVMPIIGIFYSGYAWSKKQHHARYIFSGLVLWGGSYFLQISHILGTSDQAQFLSLEAGRLGILALIILLNVAIIDFLRKMKISQLETNKQYEIAEQKFSQIFEQAYQMLFILTPSGIISQVNQPVVVFLNRKKSDIVNQKFLTIFHSTKENVDEDIINKKLEESLRGKVTKQTITVYTSNRLLKELEISFQPFVELNGEISNIIVRVHDITKQTQAFNAIQDMVIGIAGLTSEFFFKNAANEISRIYGAKFVSISLLNEDTPQTATSIVLSENKKLIPNITYRVNNSPSELLLSQHLCNYSTNVSKLFPEDEWLIKNNIQAFLGVNIKNTDKEVIGFLCIMDDQSLREESHFIEVLDIFASRVSTELKQQKSQLALESALNKVDYHITNTPLGVIEWDVDFNVTKWNKAAEKIFGFNIKDFANRNLLETLVPEEKVTEIKRTSHELIKNKGSQYNLNQSVTKNGRKILCEWYNTPLLNNENQVIGVASLVNDITAEHEALNALYVKEQEQTEIFNALIDAIFIVEHQGDILSINNTAIKLFNYSKKEFIRSNFLELIKTNQNNKCENQSFIQQIFEKEEGYQVNFGKDVSAIKKDGTTFPIYLFISKLPVDKKGIPRYICTCHDLTLFKEQQESLKKSQKMDALGNLTGGIAHDFNNILGIINGYSELLANNISSDKKLSNYAQHILKASSRGAKLTKKLLSFASKNTLDNEQVSINKILTDEFEMLQKTITPRINLTYNLNENIPETDIDKAELEDCILNLVINAMHAISNHGEITISTKLLNLDKQQAQIHKVTDGEYITLAIKDNGIGMDETTQQKALEPFFTTKGEAGTGLGLSQVYGFIERSKGLLLIDSSIGEGCEITLFLPVNHDSSRKVAKQQLVATANPTNKTILVIDDEPALVELSTTILVQAGYKVLASNSADKALVMLKENKVDAILCDVIMPNMDGIEFAKIVRKKYQHIPIQFVSGYQGENVSSEHEELINNLLKKPFSANELLNSLTELINNNFQNE